MDRYTFGQMLVLFGGLALSSGLLFGVINRFLKLFEIILVDIGNMLMATHSDRRQEHSVCIDSLPTEEYPGALKEHHDYPYLMYVRSTKKCALRWMFTLLTISSPLLTLGVVLISLPR